VSLAIDRHEHHLLALDWFNKVPGDESACFCRITQNSFLRLLTLKALFEEDTMTNSQAIAAYRRLRQDPRVGWLREPEELESEWFALASLRTPAPKRWMDAYLCDFARSIGADLVTFDRGYLQFEGDAPKVIYWRRARRNAPPGASRDACLPIGSGHGDCAP
jgi:toxin-antitoxin system PIN domain toxin